jgi:mRNA interferase RelE/StbE
VAYEVRLKPSAERELRRLPREVAARIAEAVAALGGDPRPRGVKKLVGSATAYRIRVGDYRVIYDVFDGVLVVVVVTIAHRREVYR